MDNKQKLEEIELIDPDWKVTIFSLYQHGEVYLPDNLDVTSSDYFHQPDGITQLSKIEKLLDHEIFLSNFEGVHKLALMHVALIKAKNILKKLLSLGLVDKVKWQVAHYEVFNFNMTRYYLNKNGLDFILKFQEHRDNERRHITTVSNSKKAFWVSVAALFTAIYSVYLNDSRLDLYEKQLESMSLNQSLKLKEIRVKQDKLKINSPSP